MKPLKIGAYIRVSTDDQVNTYEGSLDSQKFRIKEFVDFKNRQQKDWGNIVEFYVEEGVSAGTTNRPMYQKIMSDIRKGKVNLILVSDLTRLSRNLLDFCNLINELERHKASYLSMKEQFDTSTPIGRMMVYIIIALGQFEREQTSERVAVNCHSRALRGLLNGGQAPMGYDKHPEKPGLLIVNNEEAEKVKTIFNMFLQTGSRSKTVEALNELGPYPKRTSKKAKSLPPARWSVQSLGKLLEQPAYIGLREVNKIYKDEDHSYLKPWQKHQLVKAAWPAILDEKIFYDAQHLLEEARDNERSRLSKGEKRFFLLSNLLTCGETGFPLVGQSAHSSNGTLHRYYHYARRPKNLEVVRPRLNAEEIEEKVIGDLANALKDANYFVSLEKNLKEQADSKNKNSESEYQRAKKELSEVSDQFSMLLLNQGKMQLNETALKFTSEQLNTLAKKKEDLEKYLNNLNYQPQDHGAIKEQVLFVENQIRLLMQGWAKATPATKKRLLRRTIKEIIITRSEIHICFWLNACELGFGRDEASGASPEDADKIIPLRRISPQASDRNLSILSSGKKGFGRGAGT
ncbi:MAG: recombinase family protein [Bdellovibrionaceae bacterium]|nr:recombinase family protein [Pseudobdellovibrionaceae bacterium]